MEQKKLQTKAEWIEYYKERTGCRDLDLFPDEQIFFHPEHGFITFFVHDGILELHNMCGNGKEWQKIIIQMMKDNGLTTLRAYTERNPKAWIRKYGGHIKGWFMEVNLDEFKE